MTPSSIDDAVYQSTHWIPWAQGEGEISIEIIAIAHVREIVPIRIRSDIRLPRRMHEQVCTGGSILLPMR